jgi:predicted transcriptional regulator
MRKTVKMLKDFACNPEMSIDEYAKELNFSRTTAYERISDGHTRRDIKGTGGL